MGEREREREGEREKEREGAHNTHARTHAHTHVPPWMTDAFSPSAPSCLPLIYLTNYYACTA